MMSMGDDARRTHEARRETTMKRRKRTPEIKDLVYQHFMDNYDKFTRHLQTAIRALEERIQTLEAIELKRRSRGQKEKATVK
jgi:hypothetical protein